MSTEEEYFARIDAERKEKLKAQLDAQQAVEDKKLRKELHYFKCGKCGADMTTRLFRGVEIEECNECGAILLDPGELETLAGSEGGVIAGFLSMFKSKSE